MKPVLSILIPSLFRRDDLRGSLVKRLLAQGEPYDDIEILSWVDNKKRSIGRKRDDLVQLADGNFLTVLDDDDTISDDYVSELRKAAIENPDVDVIVFDQECHLNDWPPFRVRFGVEFENQAAADGGGKDITRKPWHLCCWRAELAKSAHFSDCSYGEDADWAKQLWPKIKTQYRIDKILHYYRWSKDVTEAPTEL